MTNTRREKFMHANDHIAECFPKHGLKWKKQEYSSRVDKDLCPDDNEFFMANEIQQHMVGIPMKWVQDWNSGLSVCLAAPLCDLPGSYIVMDFGGIDWKKCLTSASEDAIKRGEYVSVKNIIHPIASTSRDEDSGLCLNGANNLWLKQCPNGMPPDKIKDGRITRNYYNNVWDETRGYIVQKGWKPTLLKDVMILDSDEKFDAWFERLVAFMPKWKEDIKRLTEITKTITDKTVDVRETMKNYKSKTQQWKDACAEHNKILLAELATF